MPVTNGITARAGFRVVAAQALHDRKPATENPKTPRRQVELGAIKPPTVNRAKPPESDLPDELVAAGYDVTAHGDGQRMLADARIGRVLRFVFSTLDPG